MRGCTYPPTVTEEQSADVACQWPTIAAARGWGHQPGWALGGSNCIPCGTHRDSKKKEASLGRALQWKRLSGASGWAWWGFSTQTAPEEPQKAARRALAGNLAPVLSGLLSTRCVFLCPWVHLLLFPPLLPDVSMEFLGKDYWAIVSLIDLQSSACITFIYRIGILFIEIISHYT